MIFPEDRRRRSNIRLSPKLKQSKCLSLLVHQGLTNTLLPLEQPLLAAVDEKVNIMTTTLRSYYKKDP